MKTSTHPQPAKANGPALRERLARATARSEATWHTPPERAEEILRSRAAALARVPAEPPAASAMLEVVTFSLADEQYAVEAKYVREVVRLHDFTPVPGTPDFLLGVTNLRGEILAVMDLRKFFGVPVRGLSDSSRLVVLGTGRAEFGMLADAMQEVRQLPASEVREPPEAVSGIGREYLRGVTLDALIVLDGGVLLNDARLVIEQGERSPG